MKQASIRWLVLLLPAPTEHRANEDLAVFSEGIYQLEGMRHTVTQVRTADVAVTAKAGANVHVED